jgi:hypothetical protein
MQPFVLHLHLVIKLEKIIHKKDKTRNTNHRRADV